MALYRFCNTIIIFVKKNPCRLLLCRQAEGMTSSSHGAPLPSTAAALHHTGINKPGSLQQLAGLPIQTNTACARTFLDAGLVISSVNQFRDALAAFGL